jgi:hypothetical protein
MIARCDFFSSAEDQRLVLSVLARVPFFNFAPLSAVHGPLPFATPLLFSLYVAHAVYFSCTFSLYFSCLNKSEPKSRIE